MVIPNKFYHIYNRGNNRQKIFYSRENYLYFLRKVKRHFTAHLDILAYCLMPNHFHFLINTKENVASDAFSNDLKVMLRSYTRAINNQEGRLGSLFQQHTKIKLLGESNHSTHPMTQSHRMSSSDSDLYPLVCFHYIHQNPMKAKLVDRMEDWEMSSFKDYGGLRNGKLCNKDLAKELLDIPILPEMFYAEAYKVIIY